jgi:hypothetical protein
MSDIVFTAPKNSRNQTYQIEFTAEEVEKIRNSYSSRKSLWEITKDHNISPGGLYLLISEPHWVMKKEPFYLTDDDLINGPKIDYNELSREEKLAYEKVEREYWKN